MAQNQQPFCRRSAWTRASLQAAESRWPEGALSGKGRLPPSQSPMDSSTEVSAEGALFPSPLCPESSDQTQLTWGKLVGCDQNAKRKVPLLLHTPPPPPTIHLNLLTPPPTAVPVPPMSIPASLLTQTVASALEMAPAGTLFAPGKAEGAG